MKITAKNTPEAAALSRAQKRLSVMRAANSRATSLGCAKPNSMAALDKQEDKVRAAEIALIASPYATPHTITLTRPTK